MFKIFLSQLKAFTMFMKFIIFFKVIEVYHYLQLVLAILFKLINLYIAKKYRL
jgi:hypothetical protein